MSEPEPISLAEGLAKMRAKRAALPQEPNVNCLEGMACPDCGFTDEFAICMTGTGIVSDEGVTDTPTLEWGDDSRCRCISCGRFGPVSDFK